jgi:hypothetical protein
MKVGSFALALFICACLHHQTLAFIQSYEGFDYPNTGSNLLAGYDGGSGWGGPWSFSGTTTPTTADNGHRLSQDDVSLASAAFPFSPAGDRVISKGIGPGNNTWADRPLADPFDFNVEGGVRYFSFMFQKDTGGDTSNDNMEFNLLSTGVSGSISQVRFGSTSAEKFFMYRGASPPAANQFETVAIGQPYFVVVKIESHATSNDILSTVTYAPSETVPTTEPTTWDGSDSVGLGVTITGIRLWIGVPTTGQFDEIRIGTSWADVAVGPGFLPGDFNQNGTVDAADYVLWRKNPGGQFTAQDYNLWRQNFGASSSGAGLSAAVPEPAGAAILMIGLVAALWRPARTSSLV